MTILLSFMWYILGLVGFIYWWLKDYDLTLQDGFIGLFFALGGPFNFVIGWFIHGKRSSTTLLEKWEE